MRSEFSGQEPPKTTMADEMSGAAPEMPQMGAPQAPPQGGPQGGVQEQMPPTAMMAAGGAVGAPQFNSVFAGSGPATGVSSPQFGNLFGAPAGAANKSAYAPIVEAPYVAPPETANSNPYQNFLNSMRPPKGTPNTRVYSNNDATKFDIPKGMPAPTKGTPGLIVKYNKNDRPSYSWRSDADRDAYIRYMTPPEKKADGGPIKFDEGGAAWLPEGVQMMRMSGPGKIMQAFYTDPETKEVIPIRVTGAPTSSPFGDWYQGMASREGTIEVPYGDNSFIKREMEKRRAAAEINALKGQRNQMTPFGGDTIRSVKNFFSPRSGAEQPPDPARIAELDARISGAESGFVDKFNYGESERGNGAGPASPPIEVAAPTGATAPKKKSAGSAGVSGPPPADQGGLAALRAQQTQPTVQSRADGGSEYERQANALLDQLRGDKEADKNRDLNNALIQFGLGMAGSKNPNLLGAVSEGGLPAIQKYGETRESRRKEERGLTADQLAILGKKTDIDTAQSKADQDAEQARWEREYKFPEEQRLREKQIQASEASAARNSDIELFDYLMRPENAPALALYRESKSYGSKARIYASLIAAQQAILKNPASSAAAKAAAQAEIDDLERAAIAAGDDTTPDVDSAPDYTRNGKPLTPIN
jgi:hypothetical protein